MPPYAGVRKTSLISNPPYSTNGGPEQRRTTSGRAVRANTTRPANYYARPFTFTAPDESEEAPPSLGFFPAVTFFTDAISALPREVVRQLTLVKEVEAKVHGPAAQLGAMCDELMTLQVPSRKEGQLQSALMMSFTAPNSNAGSANASLINGVAPNAPRYGQDSVAGSVTGEEQQQQLVQESEENLNRRKRYAELRNLAHSMLPNLDEKNVVLTEAIRVMNVQLARIDGVMPHVESEIPEEARLGSMTHWAYSDNRIKTKATGAAQTNRRDVAATNSLAAAAHVVHESEIAQTRRDAVKEARGEKLGKGKHKETIDSEFEDKPRGGKNIKGVGKGKPGNALLTGLGISTNGEPVKRRKVEKTALATGMERQASNMGRTGAAARSGRETPRSTPMAEDIKKGGRVVKPAAPAPVKRRGLNSAQASPALASSPLQSQLPLSSASEATSTGNNARPQSARLRQNSSASNLRHERLAEDEASGTRSSSVVGRVNMTVDNNNKPPSRKRTRDELDMDAMHVDSIERTADGATSPVKTEDNRPAPSRSDSSGKTPSGHASKGGTPRSEQFASNDTAMARSRSTRSGRGKDEPSSENANVSRGHRRNGGVGSMSGLMKQIAPFNRSPDLDRHRSSRDDTDDDGEEHGDESDDGEGDRQREDATGSRRRKSGPASRPVSRHASNLQQGEESPRESGPDEQLLVENEAEVDNEQNAGDQDMADASPPALIPDAGDDDGDEDGGEPDSPSPSLTPVRGSYEEGIAVVNNEADMDGHAGGEEEEEDEEEDDDEVANGGEQGDDIDDDEARLAEDADGDIEDAEEDGDDPDPDDPDEPKYCYCMRGSYGDMVGCDNTDCPREWFHLGCTGLKRMPTEEESWYCDYCRPAVASRRRGVARGRGRG